MIRLLRSLTIATAVFVLSTSAFAAQATPAAKSATAAKPAKAPKVTAITANGTISKYDAASNTLSVTTSKGDVSFMVDSTASVTSNGKKVTASELPSHVGQKVVVHYTESNGQKTAQSVHVTAQAPKTASAKKSTKKTS